MNPTHVPALDQPIQLREKGLGQYSGMICVGYAIPAWPSDTEYTHYSVWWHVSSAGKAWYYNPPTGGMEPVPDEVDLEPIFMLPDDFEVWRQEEPYDVS